MVSILFYLPKLNFILLEGRNVKLTARVHPVDGFTGALASAAICSYLAPKFRVSGTYLHHHASSRTLSWYIKTLKENVMFCSSDMPQWDEMKSHLRMSQTPFDQATTGRQFLCSVFSMLVKNLDECVCVCAVTLPLASFRLS